mmetsp:Transcript_62686/g.111768  ORF Transcript_62686/g.111768 Transcript_62686/m.111768 type:complete len:209 (+) Transcript_62686:155-781(+)
MYIADATSSQYPLNTFISQRPAIVCGTDELRLPCACFKLAKSGECKDITDTVERTHTPWSTAKRGGGGKGKYSCWVAFSTSPPKSDKNRKNPSTVVGFPSFPDACTPEATRFSMSETIEQRDEINGAYESRNRPSKSKPLAQDRRNPLHTYDTHAQRNCPLLGPNSSDRNRRPDSLQLVWGVHGSGHSRGKGKSDRYDILPELHPSIK